MNPAPPVTTALVGFFGGTLEIPKLETAGGAGAAYDLLHCSWLAVWPLCYRLGAMTPDSGDRPYPEVAALAAHVASLKGLTTVLDIGPCWTPETTLLHPQLDVVGVGRWGREARRPSSIAFGRVVDLDDDPALRSLKRLDPSRCVVVLTAYSDLFATPANGPADLDSFVRDAPLVIIATTDPGPVLARLASGEIQPSFLGRTRASEQDRERKATLLILDRALRKGGATPSGFRAVAIMSAYNEEDIIGPSIGKLVADGIGVYLIDNWSTDRTYAIAEQFQGRGLVGLERFPDAPTDRYEWRSILRRVEVVAAGLEADWCIHHDSDERRCGPWPGIGLRDALWRVDQLGFSAVDHTVLNFRPIDNGFPSGGDFEAYFRHFEFAATSDLSLQIKAWKNSGPVDLASSGGHEARFSGRRVFPYRFELKHYPIRSQAHGEQKVFRDRIGRWDPKERALGWHGHYNDVQPQQSFLRSSGDLIPDRGQETRALFVAEFLAGAGLTGRSFPAWALGSSVGRRVYLAAYRFAQGRAYARLRLFPLFRSKAFRRIFRGRAPG